MKSLTSLSIPILLLTTGGIYAKPSDIQDTVRVRLPLYYKINDVKAETLTQNVKGKEINISQLAISVILEENLYKTSRFPEGRLRDLTIRGLDRSPTKQPFLEKVATKGKKKTIYGKLVTSNLAEEKMNIDEFNISDGDAIGKPLSAFTEKYIIIDTPEEQSFFDNLIKELTELKTKRAEEERLREEAKKARHASFIAEKAKELAEKKKLIIQTFSTGKTYDGAYILNKVKTLTSRQTLIFPLNPALHRATKSKFTKFLVLMNQLENLVKN